MDELSSVKGGQEDAILHLLRVPRALRGTGVPREQVTGDHRNPGAILGGLFMLDIGQSNPNR